MSEGQERPGRDLFAERGHDLARGSISRHMPGMTGLGDKVKQGYDQDGDWLAEIDQLPGFGRVKDALRVPDIRGHHRGIAVLGQQCLPVREHDRIVVHVHDSRGGIDLLRHLMRAAHRGQARAHVNELGDAALAGQVIHRPPYETAILPGRVPEQHRHLRAHARLRPRGLPRNCPCRPGNSHTSGPGSACPCGARPSSRQYRQSCQLFTRFRPGCASLPGTHNIAPPPPRIPSGRAIAGTSRRPALSGSLVHRDVAAAGRGERPPVPVGVAFG